GRRVALVGGNGTGKTTLLEIVVGHGVADAGEVHKPKELRVGYLPQERLDVPSGTVLETAMEGAEHVAALARDLHRLQHELATTPASGAAHDRALTAYGEAQSRFEQLGGYALEAEAQRVLAGLGFSSSDADRPVRELSGGWRMRVELARLLVGRPDVLVLDEPTNHLDVDSVGWLEEQLAAWTGAVLFVSHDRDFIDAVANRVLELAGGRVSEYVGGFAEFVVEREERLASIRAAAANQARQIAHAEQFIERFRYKATKARQVQSRVKALERLDHIEVPDLKEVRARFRFPEPPRSSRVVAELHGVSGGYDDEIVLRDVELVVERGERVALVGPNGAGKTTLLRLLLGELAPMAGEVTIGSNVQVAAFAQHQADTLDPARTVFEEFKAAVGASAAAAAKNLRTLLGSFGFPGDAADRLVGELSGGERTRLALARLMVEPVNLLVLDEPTNHLDLPSCDILEDALRAYPGTVLLVTHDRYLIREVATALVDVRDGRARWHPGVDERVLAPGSPAPAAFGDLGSPGHTKVTESGRSTSQKRVEAEARNRRHAATKDLRRRVESAEKRWERAEHDVADLQRQLADPSVYDDSDKVKDLVARHDTAKQAAADAMAEWESATSELERVLTEL
ncbi:MAG TPA: ABC-F family ATP-binding cassette domain-containing protein, partial [Acidimicrobiales bacterium]|nr:ABC-F family ATP-binding cassette domain-containing protein [Acidimicrobiales bacterium]